MPDFSKTLFVCTGNIFRSIVCEKFFRQKILDLGLHFQVRSRGTNLYYRSPNPLLSRIMEEKYSIILKGYHVQKLSLEDIVWASTIICFTPEHYQAVIKMCPSAKDKTFLIYDITSFPSNLFQDFDYHDVSENNEHLFRVLETLKSAVNEILNPVSLSIVMAVYNEEKNIKNIITKLATQSSMYKVKEIIIVSSGSTDNTDRIIQSIQSPLINLIKEQTRNGKVSALKKAALVINGDYVLLLDGDVDIEDNFIKECFFCIYRKKIPCTGKIIPVFVKNRFFYGLSLVGCKAWNALRSKNDESNTFLYPSGYTMLLSRHDFINGIKHISDTTINDDGLLSLILFQKGILFHYCDNLRVYVTFPQSFGDFFRQKIRTRMGRRQIATYFFKNIERQCRKELFDIADAHNFIFVVALLIMDYFARCIADIKIKFSRNPHLWKPVATTKQVQDRFFPVEKINL